MRRVLGEIEQWTGVLLKTEEEIKARVLEYLRSVPSKLYKSDIILNDKRNSRRAEGYFTTDSGRKFTEVIAKFLLENELPISKVDEMNAHYNAGARAQEAVTLRNRMVGENWEWGDIDAYINVSRTEPRMGQVIYAQGELGNFVVVDREVPLRDAGGKDNIDLVLRKKGDTRKTYVVEYKKERSDESLLRCILEIETYFRLLNTNFNINYSGEIVKAVMVDAESYAYIQFQNKEKNIQLINLMEKWGIVFLELSRGKKSWVAEEL